MTARNEGRYQRVLITAIHTSTTLTIIVAIIIMIKVYSTKSGIENSTMTKDR